MITKWIHLVSKLRNVFLCVPLALLDTQVVNFYVDSMSTFEEFNDILSFVSNGSLNTISWVTKCHNIVGNIRQIKIIAILPHSILILGHRSFQTQKWIKINFSIILQFLVMSYNCFSFFFIHITIYHFLPVIQFS